MILYGSDTFEGIEDQLTFLECLTLVGLNALSASLDSRFNFLLSTGPAAALYACALSPATLLSMPPSASVGQASAQATQRHSKWYLRWSLIRSSISAFENTPEYAS